MAITPLPASGDTSWRDDWATDIHNVAVAVDAGNYANASHDHPASGISDSTSIGRSVLTAATQAAARTAIGAGTSDLVIGTTSTTAKAGNYAPAAATDTAAGIVELATTTEATTGTDTTRAVTPAGLKAALTVTANTQTGTSYTLVLTDAGKAVEMNNASANTLTIPTNASVAFPVGTVIEVFQLGAGQTTVTAAGGVTLRAPDGAKTAKQYASASLRKRATDEWVLAGNTTT